MSSCEHRKKALLVIDLQQDFTSPDGPFKNSYVHVKHLVSNLHDALPRFRAENGIVIWIKSDYSTIRSDVKCLPRPEGKQFEDVPMNNTYLSGTHQSVPMCIPGQNGEKFLDEVYSSLMNAQDQIISKQYYSAFTDTTLADVLKEMDEVHISGLVTNCCVQATATDAFFYGHKVFIWIDCVGYRNKRKHKEALECLQRWYATLITSKEFSSISEII